MASGDRLTQEEVLAAFDEHLRRTRGVCAGTRRNYARFVRAFLVTVFAGASSLPNRAAIWLRVRLEKKMPMLKSPAPVAIRAMKKVMMGRYSNGCPPSMRSEIRYKPQGSTARK